MGTPLDEAADEALRPAPARRPRKGDAMELTIDGLDDRGRGLAVSGEHRVALRGAIPGARVAAQVVRRRRASVEARVLEVLDPGPHARPARCPHVASCGGCAFQTLDYAVQLAEKQRRVRALFEPLGAPVEDVVGCAHPWHYRNKMDFTFSNRRWVEPGEPEGVERDFALGLHVPGRYEKVVDVERCALHFPEADALLASVRELARAQGLTPWDVHAHTGLLRHLVLRKGFHTGEILVDVVTSDDAPEAVTPLADALLARHPEVTTLVQSVNTRPASIAVGERQHVLHGPGVIRETLLGLEFTISAASFFQTNTAQAERLLEVVREEAACVASDRVLDLYCGAGTLGLGLAAACGEVQGFELVESAVHDARRNARANGVENARFEHGDVLALVGGASPPDVCVVDPPRAGLHPKVLPALNALAPGRIVYVSCNPAAAARDVPALAYGGYALTRVRPLDLFPHTPHVECVLTLERRA